MDNLMDNLIENVMENQMDNIIENVMAIILAQADNTELFYLFLLLFRIFTMIVLGYVCELLKTNKCEFGEQLLLLLPIGAINNGWLFKFNEIEENDKCSECRLGITSNINVYFTISDILRCATIILAILIFAPTMTSVLHAPRVSNKNFNQIRDSVPSDAAVIGGFANFGYYQTVSIGGSILAFYYIIGKSELNLYYHCQ